MVDPGHGPIEPVTRPRVRRSSRWRSIAPALIVMLFGIITLGIGVFYQQQITNAAREAARFAAIHSATSQCPTVVRIRTGVEYAPASTDPYYRLRSAGPAVARR